ncbi:hypothetical protein JVT61DRAFT_1042 [Boletus reticuloceps]|uniref:Secreted protein n=1 Tax=Boletus reticuloceps TaxID=495285 RepID=A0A8I2YQ70_9AGAM|nr:hypothetical protein JVT61DRAFT_1042 [Boletus reticuloceps]
MVLSGFHACCLVQLPLSSQVHCTCCYATHQDVPETRFDMVAQLTNHIFKSGYLAPHLRSKVYWQAACGRKVEEHENLQTLLETGEGVCETSCLRLNIGMLDIFAKDLSHICLADQAPCNCRSVHLRTVREEGLK